LHIFEQIASISEPIEELVKKELLIFKGYQLDVKTSIVLFNGGKK
jgi:hypothetical protein